MQNDYNPLSEKANRFAISFMATMFLFISAGIMKEQKKYYEKVDAREQLKKTQDVIKAKTLDLSKQK